MKKKRRLDERGSVFLLLFLLLLLLFSLLVFTYFLYLNIPGSPESLDIILEPGVIENLTNRSNQFFPNMKFNHNVISYDIDRFCEEEKGKRMIEAFNEFSDIIEFVTFYESSENPDIRVVCSEKDIDNLEEKEYFIAGEGGAKEVIQTGRYNIITDGIILLYTNPKFSKCDWPNIELHELLHVFGFDHTNNKNSLMYPLLTSCDQKIEPFIVNELKRLYSEENLADLYFDDISVIKKGRYLDFNLTIKNSGTINAEDVKFSVLDEGELIETRDLDDIDHGAGIIIRIQNFKLIRRNPEEISFILDFDKKIKEIDEKNNIAKINFN